MRVVLATHNAGKRAEFARLFLRSAVEFMDLSEVAGGDPPAETGATYAENAHIKAVAAAAATGLPALADDSGLEVAALGGRPGVHSARYGGPGLDDRGRVERLLEELSGVADAKRQAEFVCVLVLVTPDGEVVRQTEGRLAGRIAAAPRGAGGFGYDPVFEVPSLRATLAEVGPAVKDAVSHRGRAAAAMAADLRVRLASLDRPRVSP